MAKAVVTIVYPFHWNILASAHIYLAPDGVLMQLHTDEGSYGTSYFDYYYLRGKRAAACRRLFKPLFSSRLRREGRDHEIHLSF